MKTKCLIALIIVANNCFAQKENTQYIHKYLMRADASIVKGYMFQSDINNVHLNGNLEYYLDNLVSVRGDANWMAGTKNGIENKGGLKDYFSVMLGTAFHFPTASHFDPYFIFQPGIGYTSSYQVTNNISLNESMLPERKATAGVVSPLGSAGIGFNYYFQRYAHLFAEGRYVYARHLANTTQPLSMQELRITFGLGFNLFVAKDKSYPRN